MLTLEVPTSIESPISVFTWYLGIEDDRPVSELILDLFLDKSIKEPIITIAIITIVQIVILVLFFNYYHPIDLHTVALI